MDFFSLQSLVSIWWFLVDVFRPPLKFTLASM